MMVSIVAVFVVFALLLTACDREQRVCPDGSLTYLSDMNAFQILPAQQNPEHASGPVTVEIRGKLREVDRILLGPLCNDHLQGRVYIGCEIQIAEWADAPRFLKECAFSVEPRSVVYVAAHNDTAFKKGCACHTGKLRPEG